MAAADQIQTREGDNTRSTSTDAAHRILAEQRDTTRNGADQRGAAAADSATMVQSGTLPNLQIEGHDSTSSHKIGMT